MGASGWRATTVREPNVQTAAAAVFGGGASALAPSGARENAAAAVGAVRLVEPKREASPEAKTRSSSDSEVIWLASLKT